MYVLQRVNHVINLKNKISFPLLLFLFSFLLRIIWINVSSPIPLSDFADYHRLATNLGEGNGYIDDFGESTSYRPIGFPLFLSLIYRFTGSSNTYPVLIINCFLSALSILFMYYIAVQLIPSKRIAFFAVLLYSLYLDSITYSALLSDTTLFTFFLLLAVYSCYLKTNYAFLIIGISIGLATLIRPFIFPFCIVLSSIRYSKSILFIVLTLIVSASIITPWTIRNYIVFNQIIPVSTNNGINLLIGNNPSATGRYMDVSYLLPDSLVSEKMQSNFATTYSINYFLIKPLASLKLYPAKLFAAFQNDMSGYNYNLGHSPGDDALTSFNHTKFWKIFLKLNQYFYIAIFIGFLFYLFQLRISLTPTTNTTDYIGLFVFLYFVLIILISFGNSRFKAPITPLMYLYALQAVFKFIQSYHYQPYLNYQRENI